MDVLTVIKNQTLFVGKDNANVVTQEKSFFLLVSLFALSCIVHLSGRILKDKKHDAVYHAKIQTIPSFPILGCLPYMFWHFKDLPNLVLSWSKNYGMTFRTKMFGKEFVFMNDPQHLKKLLWSAKLEHMEKPSIIYRFLSVIEGSLAALPSSEWKVHRHIMDQAFTYASLLTYTEVFNRHIKQMIVELHDYKLNEQKMVALKNAPNNFKRRGLYDFMNVATFKVISEIIIGSDLISTEEIETVHAHSERCKQIMSYRLYHPWLLPNLIWKLHPLSRELDCHFKKSLGDIMTTIQQSREQVNTRKLKKCILDYLVDSDLSNEEILPEIVLQYAAGHDTVTGTMNFVLFNLALNQDHQEKCRQEVDILFDQVEKKDAKTELTLNDLAELKYLEQCIKETQRMFPSTPFYARELFAPLQLDSDLELKTGTIVVQSPFILQRDARIYPDPEKFDPDRFLPENMAKRGPCTFNPFSHGPRNCIGWKVALLEMKMLTAYILRNFELSTENTMETIMQKLRKRMWPYDDFGVQWKKRENVVFQFVKSEEAKLKQ